MVIRFEPLAAVGVAAAICFVIGGRWLSLLLFRTALLSELGVTDEASRATGALLAIPASIRAAFGLGVLTACANAADLPNALLVAGIAWA
jgi:hypothetical protein